jgi:hypothetical protein
MVAMSRAKRLVKSYAQFISIPWRDDAAAAQRVVLVLSQILLEFECGHRPDIIMLRAQQTAEMQ